MLDRFSLNVIKCEPCVFMPVLKSTNFSSEKYETVSCRRYDVEYRKYLRTVFVTLLRERWKISDTVLEIHFFKNKLIYDADFYNINVYIKKSMGFLSVFVSFFQFRISLRFSEKSRNNSLFQQFSIYSYIFNLKYT